MPRTSTVTKPILGAPATCQHHWLCETTNNETAQATCKLCGETRTLHNWLPVAFNQQVYDSEEAKAHAHSRRWDSITRHEANQGDRLRWRR